MSLGTEVKAGNSQGQALTMALGWVQGEGGMGRVKQVLSRKEEAGMAGGMQPATEVECEPGAGQSRRSWWIQTMGSWGQGS